MLLPDPPESLSGPALEFYDELREMLEVVRPTEVQEAALEVDFGEGSLDLTLPHSTHPDWAVGAMVDDREAIVFAGPTHEHFSEHLCDVRGRSWTLQAVDFVAEVLRGEIEVVSEYRGRSLLRVRHRFADAPDDDCFGETGFFHPAWVMFWKPRRKEVARISFGARG